MFPAKNRILHYMGVGRPWRGAKYSYGVWERFPHQANPFLENHVFDVFSTISTRTLCGNSNSVRDGSRIGDCTAPELGIAPLGRVSRRRRTGRSLAKSLYWPWLCHGRARARARPMGARDPLKRLKLGMIPTNPSILRLKTLMGNPQNPGTPLLAGKKRLRQLRQSTKSI